MKRILGIILVLTLVVFYHSAAWGSVVGHGTRAISMGGAFTAVADDGSAPYWNPAGITQIKYVVLTPAFGAEGKYDVAQELIDTSKGLPEFTNNNLQIGVLFDLGITTRYVGINAIIDVNTSGLTTKNEMTVNAEVYGYGVVTGAAKFGDQLAIGLNFKTIQAKYAEMKVKDDASGNQSYADGEGTAFDLGILYRLNDKTRLGFTGRNIVGTVDWKNGKTETYTVGNNKSSSTPGFTPTQNIPKSYVLGIAYNPFKSLTLAADAEMIDSTDNTKDQTRIHVGLEQTTLWNAMAIRLGAYTKKDEQTALTTGLGFKLGPLLLDVAYVSAENPGYYLTAGFKF